MSFDQISWNLIIGGFGMFIFGIKFMGDGLKFLAGDKLRDYIDKYTSNYLLAILIGALVTIAIQSSSASTAITIGLVRAGLMSLEQSAAIIMGANIGTTVTSFLIGLSLDQYALYFVAIGAMIIAFSKRKKMRHIGEIIFGFGLIFYGLTIMGDALKALKDMPWFEEVAQQMSVNPFLSLFSGIVITGIIQSSAATIGVIQKIYESNAISFIAVIPFVYGANIGTTVTGLLATLGGNFSAKRTMGIHILFNVIGTVIGMALLYPIANGFTVLSEKFNISPMLQIAFVHIIFNVTATIVCFIFLKQICVFIRKIFPGKEVSKKEIKLDQLDMTLTNALPSASLNISGNAINEMFFATKQMLKETKQFLIAPEGSDDKEVIQQSETLINNYEKKITHYLMALSPEVSTENDSNELNVQLQVVKNLERIGDLLMNVTEFIDMVYDDKGNFSQEAKDAIDEMFKIIDGMIDKSESIFENKNDTFYQELQNDENHIDTLELKAREAHFKRMTSHTCSNPVAMSIYCDILSNLERMGDHCVNIARATLESEYRINIKK